MRVLFVSYAESHSNKWVNALCRRGHEIFFVMQKSEVNHIDKLDPRIHVIELPVKGKKGYILNAPFLRRVYNRIKPDVVNVHYASGYGTMARLSRINKVLLSVWGSDVYEFPYKSRFCMRTLIKNLLCASQIASTSNCMAAQVRSLIGDKRRITITPFGIDINQFNPDYYIKEELDTITIGNIKVLSPVYAIDDLVKAFSVVKKELDMENKNLSDRLRCVIYGRGELKEELLNLIAKLNLSDYIKLPGEIPHDKVPEALSKMDIFCATSISESFGVSVVEAEAMAIPVVVSDTDGFKEVTENGITGYVVKRRDINGFAHALKKLILNKELRIDMGRNGRIRAVDLYDFEDNVTTMENLYQSVAKGKK